MAKIKSNYEFISDKTKNPVVSSDYVKHGTGWLKDTVDNLSTESAGKASKTYVDTELAKKVDKVSGKGLSTNDYTTAEKTKLAGIAEGANKTVIDAALSSTSTNPVQNKAVYAGLAGKADQSYVEDNFALHSSRINAKASQSNVDNLEERVCENESDIATNSARIDSFTALADGSTTGDAELADGRVASDGTTYSNIGGAIRGQVSDLKNDLTNHNIEKLGVLNLWFGTGTSAILKPPATGNELATLYFKCEPNRSYTISHILTSRFAVGYTKEKPGLDCSVYGVISNNNATTIKITTGIDAVYLVVFVWQQKTDSVTKDAAVESVLAKTLDSTDYKLREKVDMNIVEPIWNVARGGIYIDQQKIKTNGNGFGIVIGSNKYYIAPADGTTEYEFSSTKVNAVLVIDKSQLVVNTRVNPGAAMTVISSASVDIDRSKYIIVAEWYRNYWEFYGPFRYFKNDIHIVPHWNVNYGGIKLIGENVIINKNGFEVVYNGIAYFIAPLDNTSTTVINNNENKKCVLVIDVSKLTNAGGRNEPSEVLKIVPMNLYGSSNKYDFSNYIVIAEWFETYWDFYGVFRYFKPSSKTKSFSVANRTLLENHIIAHKGGNKGEENTISNFQNAVNDGYKIIEFDVQFTSDNVPVLRHDNYITVDGVNHTISASTYSELIALKPNLAKFEDAIVFCKRNRICCDIDFTKTFSDEKVDIIYGIIADYAMQGSCLITCYSASAKQLLSRDENLCICISGVNTTSAVDSIEFLAGKSLVAFCSTKYEDVTEELVKYMHNKGFLSKPWTVNSESAITNLFKIGCDLIISDSVLDY